ncbi:SRPBCC family protein [Nocardioides mesophilus]|uniref:SRPBCC family protein n=1 Tax=Nocardioides mesophilus TaxID=433659 RepID=A0A7G9R6R3_9ACTN|nr:SRPBCC family protein [Nocardioides mesophilus]QNN51288.1 SRPBCC family protein [Nocardioides mesophilus]
MHRFSTSVASDGVVSASPDTVWKVLTDPERITRMTPLLHRIDLVDGREDLWRWQLATVPVTGMTVVPCFTERMRFAEPTRIDYTHEPQGGTQERTGVEGWYELTEVTDGTHLALGLTVHAELPLPRLATPAVRGAMHAVMGTIGAGFSRNLVRELERERTG